VRYFKGGGDTSYVGPDFAAGWFDRNLRIFRNLQRLTGGPAERILVVYGSGTSARCGTSSRARRSTGWRRRSATWAAGSGRGGAG
jgi:hypothetical protein